MDKGGGNQDTSTEVFAKEEGLWRNLHPGELLCYHREAGSC